MRFETRYRRGWGCEISWSVHFSGHWREHILRSNMECWNHKKKIRNIIAFWMGELLEKSQILTNTNTTVNGNRSRGTLELTNRIRRYIEKIKFVFIKSVLPKFVNGRRNQEKENSEKIQNDTKQYFGFVSVKFGRSSKQLQDIL